MPDARLIQFSTPNSARQRVFWLEASILVVVVGHFAFWGGLALSITVIDFAIVLPSAVLHPVIAAFCLLCVIDIRDLSGNVMFGAFLGVLCHVVYWAVASGEPHFQMFSITGMPMGLAAGAYRGWLIQEESEKGQEPVNRGDSN